MSMLWVVLGGALGAIARYEVVNMFQKKHDFPYSTLTVNIIGSALLGFSMALLVESNDTYLFFGVGFLGAFTTFSTFSVESMKLIQNKKWLTVLSYITITITSTIIAFMLFYFLV